MAYPHCAVLGTLDLCVFAALLEGVRERRAPATPGLVELRVARQRDVEAGGHYLWLHVAVVFAAGSEGAAQTDDLTDTHWQLARDVQQLAVKWGHCWPVLHRYRHGEVPADYTAFAPGVTIPEPPPAPARFVHAPTKVEKPDPLPEQAPAREAGPPAQKSLF